MRLSSKNIAVAAILTVVLLLAFAGVAAAAPPWSDAPDSYWSGYDTADLQITSAKVATVADGYPGTTLFKPNNPVSRGQFAKMAVNGLDLDTLDPATPSFKDVLKGSTFYIWVEGAYAENLIGGYTVTGGREFRWSNSITRQQTNSILARYLSQREFDATNVIHGTGGLTYAGATAEASLQLWYAAQGDFYLNGFLDAAQVAADHRATTAYLVYHDVLQGSGGKLNPLATISRAAAAVMILRVAKEAADITTPPPAPTDMDVEPDSPGTDPTPTITGETIPGGIIHIYDLFNSVNTDLFEGVADSVAPRADQDGDFTVNIPTALAEGTHKFTARVKSAAGLVSAASASVTYIFDVTGPDGEITAPAVPSGEPDAAVKDSTPVFTVEATDDSSGVLAVEFEFAVDEASPDYDLISADDDPVGDVFAADWADGDYDDGLDDGQYLFRAIVIDEAGNETIVGPVKVTVDTEIPTVEILTPQPNDDGIFYTEINKPAFTAGAADDDPVGGDASGIKRVEFFYVEWSADPPTTFAGFTLLSADTSPAYGATYPVSGLDDGHYILAVRATDRAGNVSVLMKNATDYADDVTQEIIIDSEAPEITILEPDAGDTAPDGETLTIEWQLTDVTPPDTVVIEYTLDATALVPVWLPVGPATLNDGSYPWLVPDGGDDFQHAAIRIIAVDKAGPILDDIPGHTATVASGEFTIDNED